MNHQFYKNFRPIWVTFIQIDRYRLDRCESKCLQYCFFKWSVLWICIGHFSNSSLDFLLFVHGKPRIFLKFFFFGVVDIACIDTVGFNLTFASYDQVYDSLEKEQLTKSSGWVRLIRLGVVCVANDLGEKSDDELKVRFRTRSSRSSIFR